MPQLDSSKQEQAANKSATDLNNAHFKSAPGHANLCDESAVFKNAPEHELIHCGSDVADVYCSVGLQGEIYEDRKTGSCERLS